LRAIHRTALPVVSVLFTRCVSSSISKRCIFSACLRAVMSRAIF
jgi:hypothetical protein